MVVKPFKIKKHAVIPIEGDTMQSRYTAVCRDHLSKAGKWEGDFQPMLVIMRHHYGSFIFPTPTFKEKMGPVSVPSQSDAMKAFMKRPLSFFVDSLGNPLSIVDGDLVKVVVSKALVMASIGNASIWDEELIETVLRQFLGK